jgi:hypothetical protein
MRSGSEPLLQQVGDRPRAQAAVAGLLPQLYRRPGGGGPMGAAHRAGDVTALRGLGVDAHVDAQLPAVGPALAHRSRPPPPSLDAR